MYPQNVPVQNHPIVRLLISLIVVGGILGLVVANAPGQIAEAQQTAVASSYQEDLNQLDLQKRAAQNAVDIKKIELQGAFLEQQQQIERDHQSQVKAQMLDFQAQQNAQTLAHQQAIYAQELASKDHDAQINEALKGGLAVVIGFAILILAGAGAAYLVRRPRRASASSPDTSIWQSPEARLVARKRAQVVERAMREAAIRARAASPVMPSTDGQRKWSDLPLAVLSDEIPGNSASNPDGDRADGTTPNS
ncbi:MAG TPA: hypothetical protein VJG32_23205 [Anaerolineae bacterium]|nr:hypothetical protein [Anaerolineae bacterium]